MKKNHLGLGAIAGLLVFMLVAAWVAWGPKRTLVGVMDAIESQDVARLDELVDFPAVRSQMKAAMLAEIQKTTSADPSDQMGVALGMAFVEPVLETFISAEGIIAMASGSQLLAAQGLGGDADRWQDRIESGRASLRFKSLSRAEVTFLDEEDPSVSLVILMDREGLNWRVVGGRLDVND